MHFWHSTIGKKVVMAVTGLIGVGFVIGHMTGNLLMFKGEDAMYHYATLLRTSMPLLYTVRAVLLLSVILHIVSAYQLTQLAHAARPQANVQRKPQVTTLAARTIRWGGVLLLVFIVVHILQITLGVGFLQPQYTHLDPYNNLRLAFANPLWLIFYLVSMAALGLHLYHGGWASIRTLGLSRPSTAPLKRKIALVLSIVVASGFAIIPIAAAFGAFPEAPAAVTTAAEAH